jgi:anthranilate phosphoribosyltransferase
MSITPSQALSALIDHRDIAYDDMFHLMQTIMQGQMPPVLIAALAMGLRVKKESVDELTAAAQVMRQWATPVQIDDRRHLVDIVGTGGDNSHTFNISTAATFVAAAAGARVAKHGGRSVSSTSGSADVMEALGANIQLSPEQVSICLAECGIAFMFAPNHHAAMRHAAPVRKELGVRTLFNILGPLTNPAGAPHQLMGVFHPDLVATQVRVLQRLGAQQAMVVYGLDGLDEISLAGPTLVGELRQGKILEYTLHPTELGLEPAPLDALKVSNRDESVAFIRQALANQSGPVRDVVLLNAGAALYCAGIAPTLAQGLERAWAAVASGQAQLKLEQFVAITQRLAQTPLG